jgi:hypothetical protein
MITMKKNLLLIMFFAGCFSSVNLCGQTARPKYDLQFEVSEQNVKWRGRPFAKGTPQPTHLAVLCLKAYPQYLSNGQDFKRSLEGNVSSEQSRFLKAENRSNFLMQWGGSSYKGYDVGLYGVSEKDVRIMVKSFIKWINGQAEAELEKAKSSYERNRKQKSELENLIDKQRKERKEIEAKFSELKKSVPYKSIEDAHKSLQEFNKLLQLIEVEIVGVEAKLSMIKQQYERLENQSGNYPKSTSDLLFQMRLTQEIELAGALARKNAAQSIHKKASDFSNLTEQAETLSKKLLLNPEQLKKIQSRISNYENNIANLPGRLMPIELADSKVVIYPIEDK